MNDDSSILDDFAVFFLISEHPGSPIMSDKGDLVSNRHMLANADQPWLGIDVRYAYESAIVCNLKSPAYKAPELPSLNQLKHRTDHEVLLNLVKLLRQEIIRTLATVLRLDV